MPQVGQPDTDPPNEVHVDLVVFQLFPKGWYRHAYESGQAVVVFADRARTRVHLVIYPGDKCPK